VKSSPVSDFLVEEKFTFEVGGKNKSKKQIKHTKNSFIAADNIEYGCDNTIPLWLFGFLY
jgi:helix-turn-helix protein